MYMNFTQPSLKGFTVYTKHDCKFCIMIKEFFNEKSINFQVINCDDYLKENKESFLLFIKNKANKEWNTFPIVFYNDIFIGGFTDTLKYFEQNFDFEQNLDFDNYNF